MKKITVLALYLSLIFFGGISKVFAVDPWTTINDCGDMGFPISDVGRYLKPFDFGEFFWNADHKKYCIKNNTMGQIIGKTTNSIIVCPAGYILPMRNDETTKEDDRYGCCPIGANYMYNPDKNKVPFCANSSTIEHPERDVVTECNNNTNYKCPYNCKVNPNPGDKCGAISGGKSPYYIEADDLVIDPTSKYFYNSTEKYLCETPNCILSVANMFEETDIGPYTIGEIASDALVCSLDTTVFGDHTCVRGTWFLTSDLVDWEDKLGELISCKNLYSPEEQKVCMECYKECPLENSCSYSSLGCIQTTQDGIIIRVFQIGLGIVGALAIARFIQAALLRQTADPSKIQESYDIITSIIIGIVVLLGSTVILRFIGVDILQMMPF